ncbi:MAG: DUF1722 domain-containing protein [Ghiorsea sp.]
MGKKGYSRHPETLRWVGCIDALIQRHDLLVCEMTLRGYKHHSPLIKLAEKQAQWPAIYIDPPEQQFGLLSDKYDADGREGRIPLPRNAQELWAQHKYSVMAHDPKLYREIGPEVAQGIYQNNMVELSKLFVKILREQPEEGRVFNALQHMWGYVKEKGQPPEDMFELLTVIQNESAKQQRTYLMHSTALSELAIWI